MSTEHTTETAPTESADRIPTRDELLKLAAQADGIEAPAAEDHTRDSILDRARVEDGGEPTPEQKTEPAAEKKAEATPDEQARRQQETEAETKRLAEERANIERERKELDAAIDRASKDLETAEQQAKRYEEAAQEWEADGKTSMAKEARERAKSLREASAKTVEFAKQKQFRHAQNAVLRETVREFPDLAKPDSEMTREMDALLKSRPFLLTYPDGIRDAAQFVAAKGAQKQAQALRDENAKLQAEIAALKARIRPANTRGQSAGPRESGTSLQTMTREQQRQHLLEQARRADAGA